MSTPEEEFAHELETFRTEVESGTQFFYSYLAINAVLSSNSAALDIVNKTPLFWRTNIGALQTSFFIALGRVFDQKSNHNIDKLLNLAAQRIALFSKESLAIQKRKGSNNADEWLPKYLKSAYVPTPDDFRRLKRHVRKYRQIYEKRYRDIRHKIYAHKELSKKDDQQQLFSSTNISELEKLFTFLNKLHQSLWELLFNGKKPILRPMRYSAKNMRKKPLPENYIRTTQERITIEAEKFFQIVVESQTGNRTNKLKGDVKRRSQISLQGKKQ